MDDTQARKFQKDLNAGLVALVLLAVLGRSTEDLYGYEIAKRLQKANRAKRCSRRARFTRCCGRLRRRGFSPAVSCPRTRARRGAITASPMKAARCSRSGARSGARRAASSIALLKELTHERSRRSIDEYLKQLRQALAGEDPALIQDALYDAEEYLRAEVAAHPGK